jgi:hypothetical protein
MELNYRQMFINNIEQTNFPHFCHERPVTLSKVQLIICTDQCKKLRLSICSFSEVHYSIGTYFMVRSYSVVIFVYQGV